MELSIKHRNTENISLHRRKFPFRLGDGLSDSELLLDYNNSCTKCMGGFVHKMIFCYFFVRFWFCCYTFPPLWTREIVVLANRNCATSVTRREELNKRSNRKKSICTHRSLAFMALLRDSSTKQWLTSTVPF